MAVSSKKGSKNGSQRPIVGTWLESRDDSSLHQRIAMGSKLPDADRHRNPDYCGKAPSTIRTSRYSNPGTGVSAMDSLPALTHSSASGATESVASSVGGRELDRSQRLLIPDRDQAYALTAFTQAMGSRLLGCPLRTILNCQIELELDQEDAWIKHSTTHFVVNGKQIEPPKTTKCSFCQEEFRENTGKESWTARMKHTREIHHMHGHRMAATRPDFELTRWLWGARVIDQQTYRELSGKQGVNSPPSSPDGEGSQPVAYLNECGRRRERNGRG